MKTFRKQIRNGELDDFFELDPILVKALQEDTEDDYEEEKRLGFGDWAYGWGADDE